MPHHFLKFETILQFKCPTINKATVDDVFVEFHVFKIFGTFSLSCIQECICM